MMTSNNLKTKQSKVKQSILITRPKDSAVTTAENFNRLGYKTIIEPVFKIKIIPINWSKNKIDRENLQAIILSSTNAIDALKDLALNNKTKILAVGKKTSQQIKKMGYKKVLYANNSAKSLLELAEKELSLKQGKIVYLSGKIVTLDLAKELQFKNYDAQKIVAYETIAKKKLSQKLISKLKNRSINKVLIYSKNSATIFHNLILKYDLLENFDQIELSCLSEEILNHCLILGFKKVGLIKNKN